MKNNSAAEALLKSWPRLLVEKTIESPEADMGFLQVNSAAEKIEVGFAAGREFRLVQCLFSPQNFASAKYAPVTQTYERAYGAIKISADALNARLLNPESAPEEMMAIVGKSLRALKRGKVGDYFTFISVGDRLRMDMTASAA